MLCSVSHILSGNTSNQGVSWKGNTNCEILVSLGRMKKLFLDHIDSSLLGLTVRTRCLHILVPFWQHTCIQEKRKKKMGRTWLAISYTFLVNITKTILQNSASEADGPAILFWAKSRFQVMSFMIIRLPQISVLSPKKMIGSNSIIWFNVFYLFLYF